MDTIQQLLGKNYRMFYHPAIPVSQLFPVQDLYSLIDTVNSHLRSCGRCVIEWPKHAQNEIARLVRVNWIYQRLAVEPIRKPVLVHEHQGRLIVDCGDTRLMALKLKNTQESVPVIITAIDHCAHWYQTWYEILCDRDLISQLNFDPNTCQIFYTPTEPGSDHAVSWFEIGDRSTSHHLHDVGQRLAMAQHYIDSQHSRFHFSLDWCTDSIDWRLY